MENFLYQNSPMHRHLQSYSGTNFQRKFIFESEHKYNSPSQCQSPLTYKHSYLNLDFHSCAKTKKTTDVVLNLLEMEEKLQYKLPAFQRSDSFMLIAQHNQNTLQYMIMAIAYFYQIMNYKQGKFLDIMQNLKNFKYQLITNNVKVLLEFFSKQDVKFNDFLEYTALNYFFQIAIINLMQEIIIYESNNNIELAIRVRNFAFIDDQTKQFIVERLQISYEITKFRDEKKIEEQFKGSGIHFQFIIQEQKFNDQFQLFWKVIKNPEIKKIQCLPKPQEPEIYETKIYPYSFKKDQIKSYKTENFRSPTDINERNMTNLQFIESNLQKLMRFNYNQLSQPRKDSKNEYSPRGDIGKVLDFQDNLIFNKEVTNNTNNKDFLNNQSYSSSPKEYLNDINDNSNYKKYSFDYGQSNNNKQLFYQQYQSPQQLLMNKYIEIKDDFNMMKVNDELSHKVLDEIQMKSNSKADYPNIENDIRESTCTDFNPTKDIVKNQQYMSIQFKEHLKMMQKNHIFMEEFAFDAPKIEDAKKDIEQSYPVVKRIYNPIIKENLRENHLIQAPKFLRPLQQQSSFPFHQQNTIQYAKVRSQSRHFIQQQRIQYLH